MIIISKAPAFQFYPKEYLSDYKVLRMSWEAQGIYWSLLSHIWNDTKTQYSIKNDPESIRAIFKLSKKKFEKVFKQIQWPGDSILKEEHGMLISERLKEEKEKQEKTSRKRQEAANKRWGEKESKSNASALQKECSAFASPTPIASSLKSKTHIAPLSGGKCEEYPQKFEEIWKAYPRKIEKQNAYSSYRARLKQGIAHKTLFQAVRHYAELCQLAGKEQRHIKQAKTFFGPNRVWADWENGIPEGELPKEQQHGTRQQGDRPKKTERTDLRQPQPGWE